LILNAHSFPASPLPYEVDQDPSRPDICLGTDRFHTRPALLDTATAVCRDLGWTTATDRPFSGALVPMSFYRREARVQSLMIEVNRRLYMDETTAPRDPRDAALRAGLRRRHGAAGLAAAGDTIANNQAVPRDRRSGR
jgi:N-formylglutamate amidohydrolase